MLEVILGTYKFQNKREWFYRMQCRELFLLFTHQYWQKCTVKICNPPSHSHFRIFHTLWASNHRCTWFENPGGGSMRFFKNFGGRVYRGYENLLGRVHLFGVLLKFCKNFVGMVHFYPPSPPGPLPVCIYSSNR